MNEGLHIFPEDANHLPIPLCDHDTIEKITAIVDGILKKKNTNPMANTASEEKQIDMLLLRAYQLSEKDGDVVFGHSAPQRMQHDCK